jgi:PncC family amidohydrolase
MKRDILDVSSDTLMKHGAVSDATAREMAEKIRALTKTDYAISSTGSLGPDVLEGKEKGLIYVAVCRKGKTISQELRLKGNREENKEQTALSALRLLIGMVNNE